MVPLSDILDKIEPWETKWQEKEFNEFRGFLQSLKLWAVTSIIQGIREETAYPTEILISPEDEAKSRRIEEAVTDPKVSPEYKQKYEIQQKYLDWLWGITNKKVGPAISILTSEDIAEVATTQQLDVDTLQNISFRYQTGNAPRLKLESLFPSYLHKAGWKDEQGISWNDYKEIMNRTLLRFLRTQKDVDYIGKTVADYLGADSDWMIYRTQDKRIDRPATDWQLLLNPQELTNMEISRILYDQDGINDMIEDMIILLYRFEIFEPVIKLQTLSIKSDYTSTDDEEVMRDELSIEELEDYDNAGDGNIGDYYEEIKDEPRIPMHQSNITWKYEHGEFEGDAKEMQDWKRGYTEVIKPSNWLAPVIKYPYLFGQQPHEDTKARFGPRSPWFPYGLIKNSSEMANYHTQKYRDIYKYGERHSPIKTGFLPEDSGIKYPSRNFTATPYTLESTLIWNNNDIGPILPEAKPRPPLPPFLAASPDGSRPYDEEMPLPQYRAKREKIQRIYDRQIEAWKKEAAQIPAFDNEETGLQDINIKLVIKLKSTGLYLINYVLGQPRIIPKLSTN
jgi:hypothetical protein